MNKLSTSVLERIEKEHIRPRSKWYFLLKHLAIGGASIIFILLGLIACTMIFQFLAHMMILEMLLHSPYVFLKLLWFGIPLFWLVSWGVLFAFGMVLAHESRHGYRVAWGYWATLILVIQVVGGFALYQSEIGDRIDQFMGQFMTRYERAENRGQRMWRNPDNGFLGGKILSVESGHITLQDRKELIWKVDISQAYQRGELQIAPDARVRLMGDKTGDLTFRADMMGPARSRKPRDTQRPRLIPPTRQQREKRRQQRETELESLPTELQQKIKERRERAQEARGKSN